MNLLRAFGYLLRHKLEWLGLLFLFGLVSIPIGLLIDVFGDSVGSAFSLDRDGIMFVKFAALLGAIWSGYFVYGALWRRFDAWHLSR